MKRIWKSRDGVSPVIATILMVAITVVLAAVLYVMVSGYMSGGGTQQLTGSLNIDIPGTSLGKGNATARLTIGVPAEPKVDDVTLKVFDTDGNEVTSNFTTVEIRHFASDDTDNFYKTGDMLRLIYGVNPATSQWDKNIEGYKVVMVVTNYGSTIELVL